MKTLTAKQAKNQLINRANKAYMDALLAELVRRRIAEVYLEILSDAKPKTRPKPRKKKHGTSTHSRNREAQ